MSAVVTSGQPDVPPARELSRSEARVLFDARARELLGMSGAEFIRRWGAGDLDPDDDDVIAVWMLLPFGR